MALNRNEVGLQFSLSVDFADAVRQLQVFQSRFRDMGADVQGQIRQMQASMASFGRTAQQTGQSLRNSLQNPVDNVTASAGRLSLSLSTIAGLGVGAALVGIGREALKAAQDLDRTRQTLAALTGSTEAANAKMAELRKLAQTTPGVTLKFAADIFGQFKAMGDITDQTINQLIGSVGRLNAIFSLQDPQTFARNLQQIFTGGFERDQIKEALAQVPIFEQLMEGAFKTKDASALRKLQQSGELTMEQFLVGMSNEINKRFPSVSESLTTRMDKLQQSITTALEPIGILIGETIVGALQRLNDALQRTGPEIANFATQVKGLFFDIINIGRDLTSLIEKLPTARIIEWFDLNGLESINNVLATTRDVLQTIVNLLKGDFTEAARIFNETPAIRALRQSRVPEIPTPFDPEYLAMIARMEGVDRGGGATTKPGPKPPPADNKATSKRVVDFEKLVRAIQEEAARQELRLLDTQTNLRQQALKRRYDAEEISQREFGEQTLRLQMEQAKREIAELGKQRARLEGDLARTRNAERRLQIERELTQVAGEQAIKLAQIGGLLDERAQRGTLPLFTVDPAQVEEAFAKVDPLIEAFRQRQQARLDQITTFDVEAIRTRTEIIGIENQLELRQISRTEAQERINELLRQERELRIASLELQLKAQTLTEEDRAKLEQQIALLRTMGAIPKEMSTGDVLQSVFEQIRQPSEMLKDTLNGIKAGAEQMIETLIMTGNLSGQAFLKMARASIAAMTAEATVAAIMQLAKGFGLLAIGDVAGAKAAFTSAALFKAVKTAAGGAIASVALGAIAPGGASESGGTGGRFVTGGTGRPETISLIQGQSGNRREPQVIVIRAETEPGVIVRKVVENVQNNGEMRQIIRQEIMQGVV
jgi:hypothetical protein